MARRKKIEIDFAELQREYETVVSTGQKFAEELIRQLEKLIEGQKISLGFPIQARVKGWGSIREKLDRKSLKISSVKDLQDLIGLRVIVLFRRDLERVTKILDKHFDVIHQEDTAARLAETQFGYQSIHYIIQLPKEWFALPTLSGMNGLKAELQIRTVAQHIWAASSHVLQYKHESSVPAGLRRTIHRVSALLETVDLEFERVVTENEDYSASIKTSISDQELDVITLGKILNELLPKENKTVRDPTLYGDLLQELRSKGVKTSGQLRKLLKGAIPDLIKLDKEIAAALVSSNGKSVVIGEYSYSGSDEKRWKRGVFWTHAGFTRRALKALAE